jgi:hypothetical protein
VPRNGIPGLDDALEQERHERDLPYISRFYEKSIAGESVLNVTPLSFVKLVESRNPFLCGGEIAWGHVAQFVYILNDTVIEDRNDRQRHIRAISTRICEHELIDAIASADEFFDVTFRDSPKGAAGSSPVASSCAWYEYRFANAPWNWDRDRTLNMPLRILYQQLRCQEKDNGNHPLNVLSAKAKEDWNKQIREGLKDGSITPKMLEKITAMNFGITPEQFDAMEAAKNHG